ncbi:unnamed protein product [Orchesella dallaii]|uniref:Uncharacterized protein n=1 Tax=Orchesella dallaii TaxID=48710 RepID=A0ABP1R5F6_9HEXA
MEPIPSKVYIDGFFALCTDWKFLGESIGVRFPNNVPITPMSWINFKGVSSLRRKSIRGIYLFDINGVRIYELVTHDLEDQFMDYNIIREEFKSAIDYALLSINGTETSRKWLGRHCAGYKSENNCEGCQDTSFEIYPEDLSNFGNVFQREFEELMFGHDLDVYLCAMRFGQKTPVDPAIQLLNLFRPEFAGELIVHLARDFTLANTCLLWNRELISNQIATPNKEFYVGYTGRVGNFEIDIETEEDDTADGDPVPKNIKLYSSAFKDLHRNDPAPFKECHVPAILGNMPKRIYNVNYVERSLGLVQKAIDWLRRNKRVDARLEVILFLDSPPPDALNRALDMFNNDFGADMQSMLERFEFSDFYEHIRDTLGVTVKTLGRLVEDFRHNMESTVGHFVSRETLHLAAACELLICYGIYGKARFKTSSFNTELINQLRLQNTTFRNMDRPFGKFGFTNGTIQLVCDEIVYRGNLVLTSFVYGDLVELVGEDSVADLNAAIDTLKVEQDNARITDCYEVVMKVLLKSLVQYTLKEMYGVPIRNHGLGVDQFDARIRETNFLPKSCKEFSMWVFTVTSAEHKTTARIIAVLRNIFQAPKMEELRDTFAKFVETSLYETTLGLLFPVKTDQYMLVLPLCRVNDNSFSTLSADKQLLMVQMYQMAWNKLYGPQPGHLPDPRPMFRIVETYAWQKDKTQEVWRALGHMWHQVAGDILGDNNDDNQEPPVNNYVVLFIDFNFIKRYYGC